MEEAGSGIAVGRLTRKHVRRAGHLLAAAFRANPVIGHFLHPSALRRALLPGFFRSAIEDALPLGHVYEVAEWRRLVGAAVWFPPRASGERTATPWRSRAALMPSRLAYRHRLDRLLTGFERLAEHHPKEPHWYLAFVGIDPDRQSHGLGARALLRRCGAGRVVPQKTEQTSFLSAATYST